MNNSKATQLQQSVSIDQFVSLLISLYGRNLTPTKLTQTSCGFKQHDGLKINSKNNILLTKDFSGNSTVIDGDPLKHIQHVKGLEFPEALEYLANFIGQPLDNPKPIKRQNKPKNKPTIRLKKWAKKSKEFEYIKNKIGADNKLTISFLKSHGVAPVSTVTYQDKKPFIYKGDNIALLVGDKPDDLLKGNCKLKQPNTANKKYKSVTIGESKKYIFGSDLLPKKNKILIICEGDMDALAMMYHFKDDKDTNFICFGSVATYPDDAFSNLKSRFDDIYLLYDNDKAGKENAIKQSKKHDVYYIDISQHTELNDVCDILREKGFNFLDQILTKELAEERKVEQEQPTGAAAPQEQQEQPQQENEPKNKASRDFRSLQKFFKNEGIVFNSVTQFLENSKGHVLRTRDRNDLYIKAIETQKKYDKGTFNLVLESNKVTTFHPFYNFFEKYKDRGDVGTIKTLCQSIKTDTGEGEEKNYLEHFFTKWLVSMIAGIDKHKCNMLVLVLTGKQNNGKTFFFENLLPKELHQYFALSKMDKGKDDELLMCQKLLILDDEFAGKNKTEVSEMKRLTSTKQFTLREPYGRTNAVFDRIATLCGTCNEQDIIYDYTGNRRIVPVNVLSRDYELYDSVNRIDLIMEAYKLYKDGYKYQLDRDDIEFLNRCTVQNEVHILEYELVSKYYRIPSKDDLQVLELTTTDIQAHLLSHTVGVKIGTKKLSQSLIKLGFQQKRKKINGIVKRVWSVIPDFS